MNIEKIFEYNFNNNNTVVDNDNIVLGLSGGADSIALLTLLVKFIKLQNLNVNLVCVHINHNIRGDSFLDENLCKDYCAQLGVKIYIENINLLQIKEETKLSVEEAGRLARYEAFGKIFQEPYKIFLGHNKEDNAETFFLNLLRGTGIKGLSAMSFVSDNIYRPLLNISKVDIYEYLNRNNIRYREDYTNKENIYKRNIIRNQVFPLLKEVNEGFLSNIERSQGILKEEDSYLDYVAENELCNIISEDNSISILKFNQLHIVIRKRVLRLYLERYATLKDITLKHIEQIINLALTSRGTKELNLPKGLCVKCANDRLFLDTQEEKQSDNTICEVVKFNSLTYIKELNQFIYIMEEFFGGSLQNYIQERYNLPLKVVKFKEFSYNSNYDILLRTRRGKDHFYNNKIKGHKKLKNYFIDEKIPKDIRDSIPVLAINDTNDILWILDDKGVSNDKYLPCENDKRIYIYLLEDK